MQQQGPEEKVESALETREADAHQLSWLQRVRTAIQLVRVLSGAFQQSAQALQIEEEMIKSLEQFSLEARLLSLLREQLAKMRQRDEHARLGDIYIMGGILIYCGIFLPMLISVGRLDVPIQISWIAFAVTAPSTVGFFLVHFLNGRNGIASHGRMQSLLALLAEGGSVAMTASLIFYCWDVAGWVFLLWTLVVLLGYLRYRWTIYYRPFLSLFTSLLRRLNEIPPVSV